MENKRKKPEEKFQGITLKNSWWISDLYYLKKHSKHFVARQRVEGVHGLSIPAIRETIHCVE